MRHAVWYGMSQPSQRSNVASSLSSSRLQTLQGVVLGPALALALALALPTFRLIPGPGSPPGIGPLALEVDLDPSRLEVDPSRLEVDLGCCCDAAAGSRI